MARQRTGKGQRVDTSLLEATVRSAARTPRAISRTARCPDAPRARAKRSVFAFVASDGKPFIIHLSSPQKFLKAWRAPPAIRNGSTTSASPPARARQKNHDALHGCDDARCSRPGPREHLAATADRRKTCPARASIRLREVFEDPQVRHWRCAWTCRTGISARSSLVRNGVRLSDTPVEIRSAAPDLGEHNDEILGKTGVGNAHERRSARADGAAGLRGALSAAAQAQTPAEFYRGKQMTLITSASVGGGYDQYARLLAKHMPRFIPGNPTIVVQNMPGADGIRAANYPLQRRGAGRLGDRRPVPQQRADAFLRSRQCRRCSSTRANSIGSARRSRKSGCSSCARRRARNRSTISSASR